MLKPAAMTLIAFFALNASAAKLVECLGAGSLEQEVYGNQNMNFHKASITETSRKQLRGNYTYAPKSSMNYSSIDVAMIDANTFAETGPSAYLKTFKLQVSDITGTTTVVNYVMKGKVYSSLVITGRKGKLTVTGKNANGGIDKANVDVLCGSPLKVKEVRN